MMSVKRTPGRVVWRELTTDDVEKAKAFYSALFGWRFVDFPMGEGAPPYPIAHVGEKSIGGIMKKPEGAPFPPFWLSYVSVEDVDATVARMSELGGSTMMPPTDVPEVGRLAIVSDFAGATIGLLKSNGDDPAGGRPQPGEFCWETITSPDLARAKKVYTSVLGWIETQMPGGSSTVFATGTGMEDGVADLGKAEGFPPMWVTYVVVETVEAARAKAETLGATIVVPLIEVPNVGRISFIQDPTGAHIGLFQPQF
ncbi:Glyoxalase/bleomycin resistance protein/dioxygenase [Sandaracinus amylolyticus]|uniref:Glyoxalase/bleomycin resistance protein/dioxygenase n=2 Tax=Sandaracinus amylolyticus TaxID=927083 RepID=A0A0F6SHM9_9BACT|nr:Glyoxalase/bleomycin resistance protein/dioxygenase [Sandaracinus amylolyticus]